jgi:hypothetical protein
MDDLPLSIFRQSDTPHNNNAFPYIRRYFNGPFPINAAKSAPEIPVAAGKQNTFFQKNFQSHIF